MLLACGLCLSLCCPALAGPVDSIAAIVGEAVILESDLQQAVDFVRFAGGDTMLPDSVLREQVLQQLIDNQLLQEQARRDTIDVTSEEIAQEVDASIQAMKERFPGEGEFQAALEAEGVTERVLRRRYEEDMRRKLLAQKLLETEGLTRTYISPAEAKRFYEQHKDSIAEVPGRITLAHILIVIMPSPAEESLGVRRATEVLDVLARGGDFAVVAQSFSDDKKTAGSGGDWGWRNLADIPQELALVLVQLKPGQVSPPFRTLDGYLIARLEDNTDDRARFRTILIRVPVRRSDTVRTLAEAKAIRDKAASGQPFDSLARVFSQDPMTADSGGYLGDFLLAGLTPPFDNVVAGLDSGDVSEPVLSEHGYHIIKVLDKQPERTMAYLEMQDAIRNYLSQQKAAERLEQYLGRIAENIYVARLGNLE